MEKDKIKYLLARINMIAILYLTMLCLIAVPVVANYNFDGYPVEILTFPTERLNGHVYTPVYGVAPRITKDG